MTAVIDHGDYQIVEEVVSTVCTQSNGGFRGELIRCTNPHCETHRMNPLLVTQLLLLKSGERPTVTTLRVLWELRIELERKFSNGPWDSWDGRLLTKWLEDVKQTIREAETDLAARLEDLELFQLHRELESRATPSKGAA